MVTCAGTPTRAAASYRLRCRATAGSAAGTRTSNADSFGTDSGTAPLDHDGQLRRHWVSPAAPPTQLIGPHGGRRPQAACQVRPSAADLAGPGPLNRE